MRPAGFGRPARDAPRASRFPFAIRAAVCLPVVALTLFVALGWLSGGSARASHPGNVIYVDDTAPAPGNGASWSTAFSDLQAALKHAEAGEELWVAAGTYALGPERTDTFRLKNGVAIYGGFAGDESDREQRDWEANVTVLSGETAFVYHVVTARGVDSSTILDGVTIRGGFATEIAPNDRGGGMYNVNGSPTLRHVTFNANRAVRGGGMYNEAASPVLTNVTFSENSAASGGGMQNHNAHPTLVDVVFVRNRCEAGGGMYNENGSRPALIDVTFTANDCSGRGGGMYNSGSSPTLRNVTFSAGSGTYGAGVYNNDSTFVMKGGTFNANRSSDSGGAMYNDDGTVTLVNVTFTGNDARGQGGAMFNDAADVKLTNVMVSGSNAENGGALSNYDGRLALANVTLSENRATYGGGMSVFNSVGVTVRNSILWGNGGGQIHGDPRLTVEYSLVESSAVYTGTGNINTAPQFVDPNGPDDQPGTLDDNLRLRSSSPAIDAGSNALVPADRLDLDGDGNRAEPVPLDLDGNARFVNHARADTGVGPWPVADMGAYENQEAGPTPSPTATGGGQLRLFLPLVRR